MQHIRYKSSSVIQHYHTSYINSTNYTL